MASGIRFGRIVLMVRGGTDNLSSCVNFYHGALGLSILRQTDDFAELTCPVSSTNTSIVRLTLQTTESEAALSTGYTPLLTFDVGDMDSTIAKCVQMGGKMDGPMQYPAHGKVAALRTPDGHMIGLYEPAIDE